MKKFYTLVVSLFVALSAMAQVTTSSMNGLVTDESGEPLVGATIQAVHTPSGTAYMAIANASGRFNINGMRTGGPYTVEVSYMESTVNYTDLYLKLGEPAELNTTVSLATQIEAISIVGQNAFVASKTGAADNFSLEKVEAMPTINRSVYDIVKLTPQASVSKNGGMSFAGSNNRYNSFQIDGAVANDTFGLSADGTNGAQAGGNPVSLDAIEEIQVVVAPFDVRQSGFTGGAINAITKSGTNKIKGSFSTYYNNQELIGRSNTTYLDLTGSDERLKYDKQYQETYSFTVGGPIIKNKLFLFVSGEYFGKSYPNVYSPE
ncbi:MAG: carboxypeptidase regulatory-like domain-containing protein, partial [Tidjanibacter sp.]|nr:carboxypeptidase regulatory-like domain-containing protein [Tidjanibacter sp.]